MLRVPERVEQLMTPHLLVDWGRLTTNVASVADRMAAAQVALRPHFKTSKCLEVAALQRRSGAFGFTCATPGEAAALLDAGYEDVLWAHVPVGPAKVEFAVANAARGLTVALDSSVAAAPLADAAVRAGLTVPFLLEVNTGQARAGVEPDDAVRRLYDILQLPGLRFRGVMTHEGHLAAHGTDRAALERAGSEAAGTLVSVADALRRAGHACDLVSVGSTPGLTSAATSGGVTETRPGTYVYYDANQVRLGSATLDQCALSVLSRVVSAERPGTVIIDAGLKAMSSDSLTPTNGAGIVCDPQGRVLRDVHFATANEEHGFLAGEGTSLLAVGDLVRVIPNHACGTVNMWGSLSCVNSDGSTDTWGIHGRH